MSTAWETVHRVLTSGHKGNNPDRQLRSLKLAKWESVGRLKQSGCWLRSSHHLKKRNSSLIESSCAEDVTGLSQLPSCGFTVFTVSGRRAFCKPAEGGCKKDAGGIRSANADMSSVKGVKNPLAVSLGFLRNVHRRRVSRPLKARQRCVADGKQVNIPVPIYGAMWGRRRLGSANCWNSWFKPVGVPGRQIRRA